MLGIGAGEIREKKYGVTSMQTLDSATAGIGLVSLQILPHVLRPSLSLTSGPGRTVLRSRLRGRAPRLPEHSGALGTVAAEPGGVCALVALVLRLDSLRRRRTCWRAL